MKRLTPIQLEDGSVIYMEVKEDIELVSTETTEQEPQEELTREDLGKEEKGLREILRGEPNVSPQEQISQSFQAIETTIRNYTSHTLNAFRQVGSGNIDKVKLEFGIKVGGKAGVPYVTEGSVDSHLKIVVECSFPNEKKGNNQS